MILIIMRHGQAEGYREPDSSRSLTSTGIKQCEGVGVYLREFLGQVTADGSMQSELVSSLNPADCNEDLHIDLALISPYLRTQQSFRAVAKGVKVERQVTLDSITPSGNAHESADIIHGFATDRNRPNVMLVVTHMPLVSLLSDRVCAGFNAKIFSPADTLIIDYNLEKGMGTQLAYSSSESDVNV